MNNSKIEFTANIEKRTKNDDLLNSLEDILNFEIEDVNSIRERIIEELKEIEDIKNNIEILKEKIKEIEKLDKIKETLIQKIFIEENNFKYNYKKIVEYFSKIQKIDEKLSTIMPLVSSNIEKLLLNQVSILYSKEKENQEEIKKIHEIASELYSKIKMINLKYQSYTQHLQEIYQKIQKIKFENKLRNKKK